MLEELKLILKALGWEISTIVEEWYVISQNLNHSITSLTAKQIPSSECPISPGGVI